MKKTPDDPETTETALSDDSVLPSNAGAGDMPDNGLSERDGNSINSAPSGGVDKPLDSTPATETEAVPVPPVPCPCCGSSAPVAFEREGAQWFACPRCESVFAPDPQASGALWPGVSEYGTVVVDGPFRSGRSLDQLKNATDQRDIDGFHIIPDRSGVFLAATAAGLEYGADDVAGAMMFRTEPFGTHFAK